jgi:hypothetical protein
MTEPKCFWTVLHLNNRRQRSRDQSAKQVLRMTHASDCHLKEHPKKELSHLQKQPLLTRRQRSRAPSAAPMTEPYPPVSKAPQPPRMMALNLLSRLRFRRPRSKFHHLTHSKHSCAKGGEHEITADSFTRPHRERTRYRAVCASPPAAKNPIPKACAGQQYAQG